MADESNVSWPIRIREAIHNLFGSRLVTHLEDELLRLRQDHASELDNRDATIADLRQQLAFCQSKVDRYELVLLPLTSPLGTAFTPKRERPANLQEITNIPRPKSWQEVQAEWDEEQARLAKEEQANGVHTGRQA